MMLLFPFPCAPKDVLLARLRRRVSSGVLSLSTTPVNLPAAGIQAIRRLHSFFNLRFSRLRGLRFPACRRHSIAIAASAQTPAPSF